MRTTDIKRQFKESGQLSTSNDTAIGVNEIFVFSLDERYFPYDDVLITNGSSEDCLVTINNSHTSFLPSGNQTRIDNINVTDVRVKNIGASSIVTDDIRVFYKHTGQEGMQKLSKGGELLGVATSLKVLFFGR